MGSASFFICDELAHMPLFLPPETRVVATAREDALRQTRIMAEGPNVPESNARTPFPELWLVMENTNNGPRFAGWLDPATFGHDWPSFVDLVID